jgi:HK97 family phage major capsid protein
VQESQSPGQWRKDTQIKKENMNPLQRYTSEADSLTKQTQTPQTRARLQFLLAAIKTCKEFSGVEDRSAGSYEQRNAEVEELRNYIANGGSEKRTYSPLDTNGIGGHLLPATFQNELFQGIGLIEPLFSQDNCRFIRTTTGRQLTVPGIALDQMTASIIAQNTDNPPSVNPVFSSETFGAYTFKTSPVAVSFELSQDAFEDVSSIIAEAYQVGFANGIGASLISGNGTSAPEGLLTAATDSTIVTASNTAITSDEIESVYFALPKVHRNNPKCAWVMSDGVYQLIRKAKDTVSGRPLLSVHHDDELLMGKKVLVSPSMGTGASAKFVFANLSQYVVRVATDSVRVQVANQLPGYAEQGTSLLYAFMRVDAKLIAPASSVSPAVFATLHS